MGRDATPPYGVVSWTNKLKKKTMEGKFIDWVILPIATYGLRLDWNSSKLSKKVAVRELWTLIVHFM